MQDPLGLVGKKIDDKYEIERIVGEGGFAIVYRAQHLIFKRPVAIKAFRALSDFGVEQRERLLNDFIQKARSSRISRSVRPRSSKRATSAH